MGLIATLGIMIFFLFIAYIVNNKDIVAPSVIIFVVFIISLCFNIINYTKWEVSYSLYFILVLILGFSATLLGDVLGSKVGKNVVLKSSRRRTFDLDSSENLIIDIPWGVNLFVIAFMILIAFLYYKDAIRIANLYGNLQYQTTLQAIRNAIYSAGSTVDLEAGTSTVLAHATLASKAIGYIYIYIYFFNRIFSGKKKLKGNWVNLLPSIIYLVESVLSTSRSQILYFFAGACMIYYLLWLCRYGRVSEEKKIKFIKYGITATVVFCIIFYLLGFLTRKSEAHAFFDNISVYVGGSLVSFNNWLDNFKSCNAYVGIESFVGIRKIFYRLGLVDYWSVRHLEFTSFGAYSGNVYTAFRRYLSDFGYFGMFVFQMLSTAFFSIMYNKIKKRKKPSGLIVVYGYIVYAAAMEAIDELLFSAVFEISNLYVFIYGYIVYQLIVKRYIKYEGSFTKIQHRFKCN